MFGAVLEMPREAFLSDYLETHNFDILDSPGYRRGGLLSARRLEALRPIFTVERKYLAAMSDAITNDELAGSPEAFLRHNPGGDEGVLEACRSRLLETTESGAFR